MSTPAAGRDVAGVAGVADVPGVPGVPGVDRRAGAPGIDRAAGAPGTDEDLGPPGVRGVGIDVAGVDRLARLAHSPRALARWFTEAELAACRAAPARTPRTPGHAGPARPDGVLSDAGTPDATALAALLAAKEAVIKVLAYPWDGPVALRDIEITLPRAPRTASSAARTVDADGGEDSAAGHLVWRGGSPGPATAAVRLTGRPAAAAEAAGITAWHVSVSRTGAVVLATAIGS